jgi:hypothetical protein
MELEGWIIRHYKILGGGTLRATPEFYKAYYTLNLVAQYTWNYNYATTISFITHSIIIYML